jgi:hypothetical protein
MKYLFLPIVLLLPGCVSAPVAQTLWHEKMCYARAWVEEGASSEATAFSPAQLELMVGAPDYVLTAEEFIRGVQNPTWSPSALRQELRESLARCSRGTEARRLSRAGPRRGNSDLPRLDQCSLWIYEENRRFASPMPAWGWDPGYSCGVFFVDKHVLGGTAFFRWLPIKVEAEAE